MTARYTLNIHSNIRNYTAEIHTDYSFLDQLAELPNAAVLVDRKVYDLYTEIITKRFPEEKIFLFDATENNKTFDAASEIYTWLITKFAARKNLNFISIGGGITLDVSGFVASTLYRGIQWYYVPTTLLAQVDSCIGSKTSLNFKQFKNLLGTFYPPHKIYINPDFHKTLSELDRSSGLGEIIKFLLMEGFEKQDISGIAERMQKITESSEQLADVICSCLNIKRSFMENDEFDTGRRNLLNYGHCFGHALESASGYYVPHGVAVNIGIIFAGFIAVSKGALTAEQHRYITRDICLPFLVQQQRSSDYDAERLLNNLKNDKKRTGNGLPMVYPVQDGLCKTLDLTEEEFQNALADLKKILFPNQ
ncbi:MAG: 3-dehydroquinate synthase [Lentisphaeria bacterium]|nr:3-dehydroquinate synthase [Lentisphaeria bacterium]